jgi:hypothetical protein
MSNHCFSHSKEVPRLDSLKPLEKHYSVVLPTVSHSGFLYKTASAVKPLQDRRAREGWYATPHPGPCILAWLQGQEARADQDGGTRRVLGRFWQNRPEDFLDVVSCTQ